MIKELFRGRKFYQTNYPLQGAKQSGTANVVVDLLKQGLEDTIDTLGIHLTGPVVISNGVTGTATGAYNPQTLIPLVTMSTAPQAAGLIPVNAVGTRVAVIDRAVQLGAFQSSATLPDTVNSTQTLDTWIFFTFKRYNARKGIEFAHPTDKWKTDLLTVTCGTRDQLFTGGTNTWDMSGVTIEFWADMDVDANPDNIHATELFEIDFPILSSSANFEINQLPQNVFYDTLYLITENAGALADGIINNIDVEGGGRFWLPQGENNAKFVRDVYTRPLFYDPNTQTSLQGIYVLPLRDGMWSRALDAVSTPIVIKLNVTSLSATTLVRLGGRKLVPGGIKKTVKTASGKQVIGLPTT